MKGLTENQTSSPTGWLCMKNEFTEDEKCHNVMRWLRYFCLHLLQPDLFITQRTLTAKSLLLWLYCLQPSYQRHCCGPPRRRVLYTSGACDDAGYRYCLSLTTGDLRSRQGLHDVLVPASALMRSIFWEEKSITVKILKIRTSQKLL